MAKKIKIKDSDALIVVDVQNDFIPGGALAVSEGDKVVPVLNRLLLKFKTRVFTRDWHPGDHCSFAKQPKFVDRSWPAHCVANTKGAQFPLELQVPQDALIVSKGADKSKEAYSGFQGTSLAKDLRAKGIKRVLVAGLATDYCVKATVLDAIKNGFEAWLIADAARGVDIPAGSVDAAVREMKKAGAKVIESKDLG